MVLGTGDAKLLRDFWEELFLREQTLATYTSSALGKYLLKLIPHLLVGGAKFCDFSLKVYPESELRSAQ